MRSKKN